MSEQLWQSIDQIDKTFNDNFKANPKAWFEANAKSDMDYLLAHAEDGVIWGKVVDKQLMLAGSEFAEVKVDLRVETLQQARLFGVAGEILVWRDGDDFKGRQVMDGAKPAAEIVEEVQWLWGTKDTRKTGQTFTLLREGKQGLLHAPPLIGLDNDQGVALNLRHYLDYDQNGQAYIALSRLTGLSLVEERENGA